MATKNSYPLLFKDKQNNFNANGQYNNFILNKNHTFSSDAFSGRSKSVNLERRKVLDYEKTAALLKLSDFSNIKDSQKVSHSWNNSTKDLSLKFAKIEKENGLKKGKALNASTLSLHIEAYENSNDANLCNVTKKDLKKNDLIKKGLNAKQMDFDSTAVIQNAFEFPRQQKNGARNPEIAQYRASQRLHNSNQMHQVNSQQPLPRQSSSLSLATSKMPRPAPRARKRKAKEIEEREKRELSEDIFETAEKSNDESSNESNNDSSSDEFEFEPLATSRARRSAAGTKMQELIEQQKEKDVKQMVQSEEVYKDFFDVENDDDFEADNALLKSESEVDSDFDEDEVDDDPEDVGEQELRSERRAQSSTNTDKARKKRERMMKELATSLLVEDNVVDDKTHARYIREAKLVAKKNQEDLRRIELELEKQRNETLESLRPKERIERTDVIRTKEYFDENDERIRQIFIPNDSIHVWSPSEVWQSRQHLLPPKPAGFDKLPSEKA